jgi:1-deoxy-D-xylulose-5-phosphate reductoisomerase
MGTDVQPTATAKSRTIVLLGSTGSVGAQAVDIVVRNAGRFSVVGLAAGGGRLQQLAQQVLQLQPEVVAVATESVGRTLHDAITAQAADLGLRAGSWRMPTILTGAAGVQEVASWPADVVLNAIDGAVGLSATMAALTAGTTLALANKESLIVGGTLVTRLAAPGQIVAVDSEHSAIAQALRAGTPAEVRRLIITATGGPFRGRRREELSDVTPAQALAHPTWSMGPVITVNSATLVNKGLEVIEAHLLFGISFDDIEVVLHPTSEIHSMVEFHDGAVIAQASPPDMRLAIALGLAWPERVPGAARAFDWNRPHTWKFCPLDDEEFPAVALARQVGRAGGSAPAVFNAANEVCVQRFLAGGLPFPNIVHTVAQVVSEQGDSSAESLDEVLAADSWARMRARELADRITVR